MPMEVEIKAWVDDPAALEQCLARIGTWRGEFWNEDVYFSLRDAPADEVYERFRLRRSNGQAIVTFKQRQLVGNVEVNQETEFRVDDAHAFFMLADHLGYVPSIIKRKHSRVYGVDGVRVELNEVAHLGHFVEIEVVCEPAQVDDARGRVTDLLGRLGIGIDKVERQRYNALIRQAYPVRYDFLAHNRQHPFQIYDL
jgi:adenylate cyclase, class 2